MDGSNGSTTFTDSSNNAFTLTASGNAQISTAQSKFGGASGSFDGGGDWVDVIGTGTATNFGTGDFTIEFWFYTNTTSSQQNIVDKIGSGTNAIYMDSTGVLRYYVANINGINGATLSANTWYHIALVRASGVTKLYVNGTQSGSNYTDSNNYALNTNSPRIGAAFNNTCSVNGYIDDLRITKFARYTANFSVPTAAFPDTASNPPADPYFSSTSLLLHMDGTTGSTTFVDSGPNAVTMTAAGNAQISTTQSKFGGASGSFDGNGDTVTASANAAFAFGTGDFTIEGWFYSLTSGTSQRGMVDFRTTASGTNGLMLRENNNGFLVWLNNATILSTTTGRIANQWQYVALVRSGTTLTLYVDGVSQATATVSTNLTDNNLRVSGFIDTQASPYGYYGYIDDVRITKGIARTISVPTAAFPDLYNPFTTLPVSGAALWLSAPQTSSLYTDAGATNVIKDGDAVYQWNDLSGNSRHATQTTLANRPTWLPPAKGRNGLGAINFDGNRWIDLASNASFNFGTADFTVEGWVKPSSYSGNRVMIGNGNNGAIIYFNSAGNILFGYYGTGVNLASASTVSTTSWTHFAICRSGSTLRIFLNGIQSASTTATDNFGGNYATRIGWDPVVGNGNGKYVGQIQNLLIYNGQALYTSNFTPWMS